MKNRNGRSVTRFLVVLFLSFYGGICLGQSVLYRTISFDVEKQRLDNVLEIISNKGNFYFSYKSNIIKQDSLVTLSIQNKPVREVLIILFQDRLEYLESGNYLILRYKPIRASVVNTQEETEDKWYTVTGRVLDDYNGSAIPNASVYERDRLLSTITNEEGYFKIKLKAKYKTATLSVSKDAYLDTAFVIRPKYNQNITVTIVPLETDGQLVTVSPDDYFLPDSILVEVKKPSGTETFVYRKSDSLKVERTGLGKFLLSSKQKIQNLNIKRFFTTRRSQLSLVPELSTHGHLNSQVTNKYSFNILGGYSGGVSAMELGGVFNLVRKDVQYVQLAGSFNLVGGNVKGLQAAGNVNYVGGKLNGVQLAGVYNHIMDSLNGWQLAGTANFVTKKMVGTQLAGVINMAIDSVKGAQVAGVVNVAGKKLRGAQVAGVINIAANELEGVQVAGVLNVARKVKGMQLGLINIADTVSGVSIGFLSIVGKGYHKLGISTNEVTPLSISIKTGTHQFYNIFSGGLRWQDSSKIYSLGYGIGNETALGKKIALNTELSSQYLYLGSWDYANLLNKFQVNLNVKISKRFSLYAGPSFNVYYSDQPAALKGYQFNVAKNRIGNSMKLDDNLNAWFGFNAGIHLF
jgi:CarboxypepD_reg-like domain